MIALLDINVLVALAWPNHVHHEKALRHFARLQADGWATCPVTQSGFVRISSNHRIVPDAHTPAECILLLRRITALRGHVFWSDDVALTDASFVPIEKIVGYRQVTDAHLLSLAMAHRGRLATFDGGIASLLPPSTDQPQALLVLE